MKYLLLMLFTITFLNAQNKESIVEQCGSSILHDQAMLSDTLYSKKMNLFESRLKQQPNKNATVNSILIIPVVIHIMHKGEAIGVGTNITDQAVYDRLKAINENYRKKVGSDAYANGVDIEIEFALATRDPNGLCTNGIERINMSSNINYMSSGVRIQTTNGITSTELKSISSWNTSLYYNIYLVSEFDNNNGGSGLQGYADFAASHGLPNEGAMVLSNPSSFLTIGNTETHELGHALNLYHTFEGDGTIGATCPPANGCGSGQGDCCADTPPHTHFNNSNCNASGTNSCANNSPNTLFTSNYMNYCTTLNMFTEDQKNRMRNALLTIRASYLIENGNTSLLPAQSPIANYYSNTQTICAGESIQFNDRSSCISNIFSNTSISSTIGFTWVFTNGSTILTSTLQNPLIKFTVPGTYILTYTVTNSFGTNTITVPNAVIVNSIAILACTPSSNFIGQSGYSILSVAFNTISNFTQQGYSQGYKDFSCTKNTIVNANQSYNLELKASSYTLLGATLYSTAYIDYNNNGNFEPNEKIFEGQLVPGVSLYTYNTLVLIPNNVVNNTYLRMRVIGSTTPITNDLMNCNTNYERGDVEDYAVFILNPLSNHEFSNNNVTLFPNPVKDNLTIESFVTIEKIQVYSSLGQLIFDNNYQQKKVIIDAINYSKGIYFVAIVSEGKRSYYKIIKE